MSAIDQPGSLESNIGNILEQAARLIGNPDDYRKPYGIKAFLIDQDVPENAVKIWHELTIPYSLHLNTRLPSTDSFAVQLGLILNSLILENNINRITFSFSQEVFFDRDTLKENMFTLPSDDFSFYNYSILQMEILGDDNKVKKLPLLAVGRSVFIDVDGSEDGYMGIKIMFLKGIEQLSEDLRIKLCNFIREYVIKGCPQLARLPYQNGTYIPNPFDEMGILEPSIEFFLANEDAYKIRNSLCEASVLLDEYYNAQPENKIRLIHLIDQSTEEIYALARNLDIDNLDTMDLPKILKFSDFDPLKHAVNLAALYCQFAFKITAKKRGFNDLSDEIKEERKFTLSDDDIDISINQGTINRIQSQLGLTDEETENIKTKFQI